MLLGLQSKVVKELKDVQNFITNLVQRSRRTIDGHLGFGDGSNPDNMFGVWVSYTTNGSANTEDTIAHNMGLVPVGYLVFVNGNGGVLYKSTTAWTKTNIFLKCTTASNAVLIFVIGPSNQDI